MALLTLPNELLLEIFPSLTDTDDIASSTRSLASASRVNRRLHTLVEPFLYTAFEATEYTIGPFLRTIVERPYLGEYTTTVANEDCMDRDWMLLEEQQSSVDSTIKAILDQCGISGTGHELELDANCPEIMIILVPLSQLLLTSGLTEIAPLRSSQPAAFPSSRVKAHWTQHSGPSSTPPPRSLFPSPAACVISARSPAVGPIQRMVLTQSVYSRSLFFPSWRKCTWCTWCGEGLSSFISVLPNLRELRYETGGALVGDGEFNPRLFYRALETARERMESVDIRGEPEGYEEDNYWESFKGFGKLRRLGLASDAVEKRPGVLKEILPTGLEEFLIRVMYVSDMMLICEEVLAVVKMLEKWPRLGRVRIAVNFSREQVFMDAMERVKEARILAGGSMRVEIEDVRAEDVELYTMAASASSSSDPTTDPFSPHFSGPFQGIPPRTLPTDTLAFTVHLLPAAPARLTELLASVQALAKEWTKDYIWQRVPFSIDLSPDSSHLHGTLEYGDAIDDEWFVVSILLEASRKNPDAWIRVWDSDGEFLLIEAAHALPRWLNPEVAGNRVWIRQGKLWIIPMVKRGKREISLEEALKFLGECDLESLTRDKAVEKEALLRTKGYPEKARGQLHRARVVVPRRVAALLKACPESIAAAVEAFYIRDPVSLMALKKKERVLPWDDTVEAGVMFTKVLFAQLKGQVWSPPKESMFPQSGDGKVDVGVKLTAGFEMLLAKENDVLLTTDTRKKMVDEIRTLIDTGLVLPTDEECAGGEEDGEEWLHIDFTEFEKDLKGRTGVTGEGAYGDPEQEEKLKRMVERFEAFLNDDSAGPEGAQFRDEMDSDNDSETELNSDDDISSEDDDGEDKDDSFDEAEFERMMKEMMGLPPGDDDDKAGDDGQDYDDEEEKEVKKIQDQIEKELREAGVIKRTAPKIEELRDDGEESQSEEGGLNTDYELAANMLESIASQAGLSGPAGNMLARLGIKLPRDEPGPDERVKDKGKGKEVVR
ncbi:SGT1-domain-containing protein [Wilcoxina mikolae CBS 423.85]|nr:SGT1-domain-containing protein [Wilcoxina mikolae CBS 423.85]